MHHIFNAQHSSMNGIIRIKTNAPNNERTYSLFEFIRRGNGANDFAIATSRTTAVHKMLNVLYSVHQLCVEAVNPPQQAQNV